VLQGFSEELATLPGAYARPSGRLLLAEAADGIAAGCVGVRRLKTDPSGTSCELKRLWVRPAYRGLHVGHALTSAALEAAREVGYTSMKLDTLPEKMPAAVAMYRHVRLRRLSALLSQSDRRIAVYGLPPVRMPAA
jgi:ribosomal protein S18 acetylase RimI-like enzyme